jgi:hypothetical protein
VRRRGRAQIPGWRSKTLGCALWLTPLGINAADDPAHAAAPVARCEVAVVNPVSGFAECVKPRGVPVEPPPAHPAPTPEQCRRHADLDLKSCPDGNRSQGARE